MTQVLHHDGARGCCAKFVVELQQSRRGVGECKVMASEHKYVRHSLLGFIIWPKSDDVWHSHIGRIVRANMPPGELLSAGFATFNNGVVTCHGRSESLNLDSRPDDSSELAKQLGIKGWA